MGREDTAEQRGGTRYKPLAGRAAAGGTHVLWSGQEEQGGAASTKLKQSNIYYQESIVKIGDATGAAEKQGFKGTCNNRAGGWYNAELVHRVICTHGRNPSSILNIGAAEGIPVWQLTVHWIQMVSTGDWAPFLKVITATDTPLPWGFLLTDIFKMGTFSQFPVPWKSNCEFCTIMYVSILIHTQQNTKRPYFKKKITSGKGLLLACEITELSNNNYQLGYLTSFLPHLK